MSQLTYTSKLTVRIAENEGRITTKHFFFNFPIMKVPCKFIKWLFLIKAG